MSIDFTNPKPLYQQIADTIKAKIDEGQLKIGDQLASQKELANEYHVSLITVKKAIADLIKEGVLFSRVGKGIFVAKKPIAHSSINPTIGIVLRDIDNPFFSLIAQSFEKRAYQEGYNILLSNSSNQMDKEEKQIQNFLELGVNGLIIASMSHIYQKTTTIEKLHLDKFPYVMVSYSKDKSVYFVGTDHEKGGYIAAQHLISLNYQKIGYINAELGNPIGELRKKGFLRALQEKGIKFKNNYEFYLQFRGDWDDYFAGYEIGEAFIKLKDQPEAMFVYKDLAALGFQRALLNNSMNVPGDVAIVGFDDIKRGVVAPVPLTTIHQPTDKIGELAVELIKKQIRNETIENPYIILEPSLVIRESCGANQKSPNSFYELKNSR